MAESTVERICLECQKPFAVLAKYTRRKGKGVLCSRGCRTAYCNRRRDQSGDKNPNWKGGVSKDHYRYKKRFAKKNPEKVRAHQIVHRALEKGSLARQPCTDCSTIERVHAHHHDYKKPLDVTWLCQPCHNRRHAEERRAA